MKLRNGLACLPILAACVMLTGCWNAPPPALDDEAANGWTDPSTGILIPDTNDLVRGDGKEPGTDLIPAEKPTPDATKPTTVPPTVPTAPPSASGLTHPGVLVGASELEMVRAKVSRGEQPWAAAFARMRDSGSSSATAARPQPQRLSSLSYRPAPVAEVRCWAGTGMRYAQANPQLGLTESGCREQTDDAMAAYTHALMWYFTGNEAHAEKAIEIMDAWSTKLTSIPFDQPRTDKNQQIFANGILQAAWTGQLLPRAAEIIRYTYDGWSPESIQRLSRMLDEVLLPVIWNGWTGGANGLMSYAEAVMGIGVFNDDVEVFEHGIDMWRRYVRTTIYSPSDGAAPAVPSLMYAGAATKGYWFNPTSFVPGLHGETGRDLSHVMLGMGAMANGAATASLQGVDLFGEEQERITAAYELHASYVNQYLDEKARRNGAEPDPSWRPVGWVNPNFAMGGTAYMHGWEVAYGSYATRGVQLPQTDRLVRRLRPAGPAMTLTWETLTHAR